MLLKNPDRSPPPQPSLAAAARDLQSVVSGLAAWRASTQPADSQRLEQLQTLLQQIQSIDALAAESRSAVLHGTATVSGDDPTHDYEQALQSALDEINCLAAVLDGERQRLSPRLDAGVREREFRNAYARTLAQQ